MKERFSKCFHRPWQLVFASVEFTDTKFSLIPVSAKLLSKAGKRRDRASWPFSKMSRILFVKALLLCLIRIPTFPVVRCHMSGKRKKGQVSIVQCEKHTIGPGLPYISEVHSRHVRRESPRSLHRKKPSRTHDVQEEEPTAWHPDMLSTVWEILLKVLKYT